MDLDPVAPLVYPRLIRRVRATLIDSVLVPLAAFGILILGDALGVSHAYGKLALIIVPIFVLEPGLVALTGGTVGHHLMKIRIATLDGQRHINIFAATLRFLVKLLLGWLSLILVFTTKKHQAVHDLLARSVVVLKDPGSLPAYDVLAERVPDSAAHSYPAAWRRVLVIFGYWILANVALSISRNVVASSQCIDGNRCATAEYLLLLALNIAWLLAIGAAAVWGWRGQLYGCRKRPHGVE